jgi:hypothetical protein
MRSFIRADALLIAPVELIIAGYTALITIVTQTTAATISRIVLSYPLSGLSAAQPFIHELRKHDRLKGTISVAQQAIELDEQLYAHRSRYVVSRWSIFSLAIISAKVYECQHGVFQARRHIARYVINFHQLDHLIFADSTDSAG